MTETAPTQPAPAAEPAKKPKEDWKQKYFDLDAKYKELEAKANTPSPPNVQSPANSKSEGDSPPSHDHTHENCPTCKKSIGEHFVRVTEPYCPTCKDKNPNFKSLVYCDPSQGGCGLPLGTKEEALKLTGCPNCGNTHGKEFKYK